MGYRGFLQVDKTEHRREELMGIFRECSTYSPMGGHHCILIIAKIKADYKSPYSITEVATLIRISALERVDLRNLITKPKDSIIQNKNIKELTLFDEF